MQCQKHGEKKEKSHTAGQTGPHSDGHPSPKAKSPASATSDGRQDGKQSKVSSNLFFFNQESSALEFNPATIGAFNGEVLKLLAYNFHKIFIF